MSNPRNNYARYMMSGVFMGTLIALGFLGNRVKLSHDVGPTVTVVGIVFLSVVFILFYRSETKRAKEDEKRLREDMEQE